MSWNNKQDDFYRPMNDNSWNSDEQYRRNDGYHNTYTNQYSYPNVNGYTGQQPQTREMDEYKKNSRVLLRVLLVCVAIIIVSLLFTFLQLRITRNVMEKKIKNLNYTEYSHQSNEQVSIDDCAITVSDVYMFYDETKVWMPDNQILVGVYVEAKPADDGYSDGIKLPYLKYGDGYYVYPVKDQNVLNFIEKEGIDDEQFLSSYIGSYETDTGFYFFIIDDEEAKDFVLIIDEYDDSEGRMEYLQQRHFIELDYAGAY